MWFLNPWVLGGAATFLGGMFAGSQVDDAIEPDTTVSNSQNMNITPFTAFVYVAGGLGLWWLFKKASKA